VLRFLRIIMGEEPPVQNHPWQAPWALPVFPGLRAQPWHNASTVPGLEGLVATAPVIAKELAALTGTPQRMESGELPPDRFVEYLGGLDVSATERGSWSIFPFSYMGIHIPSHIEACPRTFAAVQDCAGSSIRHLWSDATFSRLGPRSRLAPHNSADNLRLRVHVPLVLPEERSRCTMQVGREVRNWAPGELLVFDDSFRHLAANRTSEERIVLIVDIWHPELTELEREVLLSAFAKPHLRSIFARERTLLMDDFDAFFAPVDPLLRGGWWD
jgi:aspartate beta-hydroxylase